MLEEKKSSKKKIVSIVCILILIVAIVGVSFAIWNYAFTGNDNVIGTDEISIEYLESTDVIAIDNALPMSDQEGKLQEETFDFEVTTRTGSNINIGYSLILDKLEVDDGYTPLNDSDIKLYLTDESDKELVLYNINAIDENYVIYSDVNSHDSNNKEIKDRYSVRIWIDEDVDASSWDMNTKLQYKFRINVESSETNNLDVSGANYPTLTGAQEATVEGSSIIPLAEENIQITKSNMIPVYYDEAEATWKKADETNTISAYKWYDYEEKMWANSVTVTSDTREGYQNAPLGTAINMEDILTMQVWIPRYKYKVWNYNLDGTVGSKPQSIQIVFENGTESTGQIDCVDNIQGTSDGTTTGKKPTSSEICKVIETGTECTDETCNGKTYTHPAFTFGEDELTGFWVGKFEVSSDVECNTTGGGPANVEGTCNVDTIRPLVKPNVISWRSAMVGVFETSMMSMNDVRNKYGFNETDDTHMIKNSEWGVVAYLSHSKYGQGDKEVAINSMKTFVTGCGPQSSEDTTSGETCNEYNTALGQLASTTGNVYGIYDMSGGANDYTMGNIISLDGENMLTGNSVANEKTQSYSGYTGILYKTNIDGDYLLYNGTYNYPKEKYYDKYSFNTSSSTRRISKLGDGIKEMLMWYNDYFNLPFDSNPWFNRGGYYDVKSNAGVFSVTFSYGRATSYASTHLVISNP